MQFSSFSDTSFDGRSDMFFFVNRGNIEISVVLFFSADEFSGML